MVLDDRAILRGFDLDIEPGLVLVRGPNGSGKTTLLRALAGLLPIAAGERRAPEGILYVGHRPQLLRGLSARDNLHFFSAFRGGPAIPIEGALAAWGVDRSAAARPVERLSAGQRRRAALARLDTEPCPLVLLDEPFSELDDDARDRLGRAIARLTHDGCALVVATHAHPELDAAASAVVRLS